MMKKCKIYYRVPGKPGPLEFDTKDLPKGLDLMIFENLSEACTGGGGW